jgi:hypothetical protein
MSTYSTVVRQLARQRTQDVKRSGVEALRRVRAGIVDRQQQAEHEPVRPHDDDEQRERMHEAKEEADRRVRGYLEDDTQ